VGYISISTHTHHNIYFSPWCWELQISMYSKASHVHYQHKGLLGATGSRFLPIFFFSVLLLHNPWQQTTWETAIVNSVTPHTQTNVALPIRNASVWHPAAVGDYHHSPLLMHSTSFLFLSLILFSLILCSL